MKVKLKVAMANPKLVAKVGDIVDVPEADARKMIEDGSAESPAGAPVEAAKSGVSDKATPPPAIQRADAPQGDHRATSLDDPNHFRSGASPAPAVDDSGKPKDGSASNEGEDRMGGDKVGADPDKQPSTPSVKDPNTAKPSK